jgi:hypothetical protein
VAALHKTQVFLKLFPFILRQAGGYATGWLNTNSILFFSSLYNLVRKGSRDLRATIPGNLDFVNGGVTKNACLNETDSQAQ